MTFEEYDAIARQMTSGSGASKVYGAHYHTWRSAIQLFGNEPEILAHAIEIVREKGVRFDILDINMGCPAPKITGSGAGSKLMLDPALCGAMVKAARL